MDGETSILCIHFMPFKVMRTALKPNLQLRARRGTGMRRPQLITTNLGYNDTASFPYSEPEVLGITNRLLSFETTRTA
jgi:hypothetical protein